MPGHAEIVSKRLVLSQSSGLQKISRETRRVSTTVSNKTLTKDNLDLFLNGAGDIEAADTGKAIVLTAFFVVTSKVCQASAPCEGAQGERRSKG